MNRIKDHICFAACFAGLGYMVLWPITADDLSGQSFGGSLLCRGGSEWLDSLCNFAHPLRLPPGLHALGFMSAVFVAARLLVGAVKRSRRASPSVAAVVRMADEPPPRKPRPPLRQIKPRTQFGLRGIPR